MSKSLIDWFDEICFDHGDEDAIEIGGGDDPLCYIELQEYSIALAAQLCHRYRPDHVLIDCFGHVGAEAVSLLACMRAKIPFVPVSVSDQHAGGRLNTVVETLAPHSSAIVAICCCEDDTDPLLGVFYQASVHRILFVDERGTLREALSVPRDLPIQPPRDNLYVLFTSGTSSSSPKAVVGSATSTSARIRWFHERFAPSARVARRNKLTFVDGITELLQTLLESQSLLIAVAPEQLRRHSLVALLEHAPTQMTVLPSQLEQLLLLDDVQLKSLERLIVSGEPFGAALWQRVKERLPNVQVMNLYGQTESTGDVLSAELNELVKTGQDVADGIVAVGQPLLECIRVTTTPDHEVVVQGNLAIGYLGSESFQSFPTGDVGFCRNKLWYIQGRCNDVEKINGIWVSPSEVEAAWSKVYGTSCAASIVDSAVYVLTEQSIDFSREHMHELGVPWHLIPKRVFVDRIPVSETGAGKVNRSAVHEVIENIVRDSGAKSSAVTGDAKASITSLVASTLQLGTVDKVKSFVELGGDSALAVTLLYQIRRERLAYSELTATDILLSESIHELDSLARGEHPCKRSKHEPPAPRIFVPPGKVVLSPMHIAVLFAACVDAPPSVSVSTKSFVVGCQGGLVQRIDFNGNVQACRHFLGWSIEAECLVLDDSIIVAAYRRDADKGMIVCLDLHLQQELWKLEKDAQLRTAPVLLQDCICVATLNELTLIHPKTGDIVDMIKVPGEIRASPAIGDSLAWYALDSGLLSVDVQQAKLQIRLITSDDDNKWESIGPIYKSPSLCRSGQQIAVSGSYGSIYTHSTSAQAPSTIYSVSHFPLTAPLWTSSDTLVVGCHDGHLYHVGEPSWQVPVGAAAVVAAPLVRQDGSVVAVTTAGDVVVVQHGHMQWQTRLAAEVWSPPVALTSRLIAVGARDSRVHILTLPMIDQS